MKQLNYLALAALSMALIACNSKPAESQQTEEQQETVEVLVEELDAEAEPAETEDVTELLTDSVAPTEEPAEEPTEEPAAEEPTEEPAPEKPAAEEPAVPSDKYAIDRTDGNYVALQNEIVTADAEGCINIAVVFDKVEESNIRLIVCIERLDGKRIGLVPFAVAPGGTKASLPICASMGGVMSAITPGEQYKLSFTRAVRL